MYQAQSCAHMSAAACALAGAQRFGYEFNIGLNEMYANAGPPAREVTLGNRLHHAGNPCLQETEA